MTETNIFIGEYRHSLDEKGRVAIPVKFRRALHRGAVVTRGLDGSLVLYPEREWRVLAEKLARLPIAKANTRAFARLMLSGAMDVELDGQGRMIIPDYLRQYAAIRKHAVFAGLYNRLEIWDENRWDRYKAGTEKSSGSIAEALGELGV